MSGCRQFPQFRRNSFRSVIGQCFHIHLRLFAILSFHCCFLHLDIIKICMSRTLCIYHGTWTAFGFFFNCSLLTISFAVQVSSNAEVRNTPTEFSLPDLLPIHYSSNLYYSLLYSDQNIRLTWRLFNIFFIIIPLLTTMRGEWGVIQIRVIRQWKK